VLKSSTKGSLPQNIPCKIKGKFSYYGIVIMQKQLPAEYQTIIGNVNGTSTVFKCTEIKNIFNSTNYLKLNRTDQIRVDGM